MPIQSHLYRFGENCDARIRQMSEITGPNAFLEGKSQTKQSQIQQQQILNHPQFIIHILFSQREETKLSNDLHIKNLIEIKYIFIESKGPILSSSGY